MKKIIMLVLVVLFAGCTYGINHNTAVINGKPYLVESRNRTFLFLLQWADEPYYYDLEKGLERDNARKYLAQQVREKCPDYVYKTPMPKTPEKLRELLRDCVNYADTVQAVKI